MNRFPEPTSIIPRIAEHVPARRPTPETSASATWSKLEDADAEEQGGHAFHVMYAYVQSFETNAKTAEDQAKGRRALALLQLLGLFDRPATADCLKPCGKAKPSPD